MNNLAKRKHHYQAPAIVVKPEIIQVPKEQWRENKKRMFQWADIQIAKHGYNGNTANVLKELINCTNQKGVTYATLETIHNRLIQRYGKGAPSRRTVDNCIAKLIETKCIKRSTQERVKTLVKTRLLMGKLASGSTQKLRTEYISPKRYIYTGKAISTPIAAFPSTSNQNIQKHHVNAPVTPLGSAQATGVSNEGGESRSWQDEALDEQMKNLTDEQMATGKKFFQLLQKRLRK